MNRLRKLEHALHCRDGLSVRQVQRALLAEHALRRSIGAISGDLSNFECPQCA